MSFKKDLFIFILCVWVFSQNVHLCVVSSYRSSHEEEPVSMSDALELELQLGPHILNIQEIPSLQASAVVIYIQMQFQSSSCHPTLTYLFENQNQ